MKMMCAKILIFFVTTFVLMSCSLFFGSNDKIDLKSHNYQVLRLDLEKNSTWQLMQNEKNESDIAFKQNKTGAIISLNSVCKKTQKSLKDLMGALLLDLNSTTQPQTQEVLIDGTQALAADVQTKTSDGITILIRAIVLYKSGCTFDLLYIASQSVFKEQYASFERFLKGFHVQ